MRPARKGPENLGRNGREVSELRGFNEAGPQGAGKPRAQIRRMGVDPDASMRPARKGPENQASRPPAARRPDASMRPARKGPENRESECDSCHSILRFNEAGPQGAGKPPARLVAPRAADALQ